MIERTQSWRGAPCGGSDNCDAILLLGIAWTLVAMALFLMMLGAAAGSIRQPLLYWVAHALKFAGGAVGGVVAARRSTRAALRAA